MIPRRREMRLTPELVARVAPYVGDPGPVRSGLRLTVEADHEIVLRQILEGWPETGDVWIFADGSLIWRPDFDFVDRRVGRLHGWHRSFCLGWDRRFRGSTERPGLTMALDRGGECKGVVYQLPKAGIEPNLGKPKPREMPVTPSTLLPRWTKVKQTTDPFSRLPLPLIAKEVATPPAYRRQSLPTPSRSQPASMARWPNIFSPPSSTSRNSAFMTGTFGACRKWSPNGSKPRRRRCECPYAARV